jgi:probable rRNA maturation factor
VNTVDLQKFANRAMALCLRIRRRKRADIENLKEISVLIVSDRRIASLHQRFMHEAGPTDVMTFQHGEIFISAETATRNARRFGTTLAHELRLYIIHGLLHLRGFDDRTAADARKMKILQEKILRTLSRRAATTEQQRQRVGSEHAV